MTPKGHFEINWPLHSLIPQFPPSKSLIDESWVAWKTYFRDVLAILKSLLFWILYVIINEHRLTYFYDNFTALQMPMFNDCLTNTWWLPTCFNNSLITLWIPEGLTTPWWLLDNCLTNTWQMPDNCLTIAWQLPVNCLTIACQLTSAWQPKDYIIHNCKFDCPINLIKDKTINRRNRKINTVFPRIVSAETILFWI